MANDCFLSTSRRETVRDAADADPPPHMSGYTADVIAREGVLDEGVHFIQKPLSPADLAAKLREVVSADV